MTLTSAPPGASGPVRRSPSRRRWIVGLVLVLVALVGVVGYLRWWTRPTALGFAGNGLGSDQVTGNLHLATFDMVQRSSSSDAETVALDHVEARVRENTARATITFAVCRAKERFMMANASAARACATVSEVEGRRLRLSSAATGETIVMTVTPHRAGRVIVDGIDVAYARGGAHLWQRGTQRIGPDVTVTVRA